MGSIKVNLTNGTSKYINLDNATMASIFDVTYDITAVTVGPDTYNIKRFKTPGNELWPIAQQVAYQAISATPVEFGYPILASNLDPKAYHTYDAASIGNNVIASALDADAGNIDSVWSERSAISLAVTSEEQGQELADQMQAQFKDAESEAEAILLACTEETTLGNTFDGPCGQVLPINGGVNEAGCQACKDSFLKGASADVAALAGVIEWKHQSIFLDVDLSN